MGQHIIRRADFGVGIEPCHNSGERTMRHDLYVSFVHTEELGWQIGFRRDDSVDIKRSRITLLSHLSRICFCHDGYSLDCFSRLGAGCFSFSSSSGVKASLTPSTAPPTLPLEPLSVMPSINSVRSLPPCWARSRRLVASAKRRYVSTLAMTIRASIVRISIPTSETRMYASMTSPLSRISSTTSASELEDGRST